MTKPDVVKYKDYVIYPMALFLPYEDKWQPIALITHDTQEGMTLPRSQSFSQLPDTFDEEEAALDFVVQYAEKLIDGKQPGLNI
jgi:hypothetical protein